MDDVEKLAEVFQSKNYWLMDARHLARLVLDAGYLPVDEQEIRTLGVK